MVFKISGVLFLLAALGLVAETVSVQLTEEWKGYKEYFNKTYGDDLEEVYRYRVWTENYRKIKRHNVEANMGLHSYWVKMNHLGDMQTDEINNVMNKLRTEMPYDDTLKVVQYNNNGDNLQKEMSQKIENDGGYNRKRNFNFEEAKENLTDSVPDSIDWRTRGYVTSVKYQGHCGSCYAFSATGSLEGQHFRKTGKLVSLSEQNIVDCTSYNKYHDHGCHGGLMDHAFRYIINNGGVDTEAAYPYSARVGSCKYNSYKIGAKAKSYKDILPRGNEDKLKEAVGTLGPVSVGIDAHGFGFHFYYHGIYSSWFCSSKRLNHGVLVVGYDSDDSGHDYWVVKNSWGSWWGLSGYVKMSRNNDNSCGIASLASIPIV